MLINRKKSLSFLLYLVLISPFVFIYMWLYIVSMDTALDRQNYLTIMNIDVQSRVEPLLPFLAYCLEFIITNNAMKLVIIQFIFIFMLVAALYNYLCYNNVQSFFKCVIAFLLCILVGSHALGVQLRIGYAVIFFIYLLVTLRKINIFILLPILMHYGVVFGVAFLLYIKIFKIDSDKKFIVYSILMLTVLTIFIGNINTIFELMGVGNYYYSYLDEESSFGRALPFSVIIYIFFAIYIFFKVKEKSVYHYFSLSGLWLVYLGFVLDFYLAFKMLLPILIFTILYFVKNLPRDKNSIILLMIIFILIPLSFYYYAYQVKVI